MLAFIKIFFLIPTIFNVLLSSVPFVNTSFIKLGIPSFLNPNFLFKDY